MMIVTVQPYFGLMLFDLKALLIDGRGEARGYDVVFGIFAGFLVYFDVIVANLCEKGLVRHHLSVLISGYVALATIIMALGLYLAPMDSRFSWYEPPGLVGFWLIMRFLRRFIESLVFPDGL